MLLDCLKNNSPPNPLFLNRVLQFLNSGTKVPLNSGRFFNPRLKSLVIIHKYQILIAAS